MNWHQFADIIRDLSLISGQILKQPGLLINPKFSSPGLVDSFHLVDLALFVEDAFGVRLDDTELNAGTFDTLSQLAELIHQRAA
jgi:acyl carrier protein